MLDVGGIFLPDTPNSLVERGKVEKGKEVLQRVRGTPDVDAEFRSILVADKMVRNMENPWRAIFRCKLCLGSCYRALCLHVSFFKCICLCWFCCLIPMCCKITSLRSFSYGGVELLPCSSESNVGLVMSPGGGIGRSLFWR